MSKKSCLDNGVHCCYTADMLLTSLIKDKTRMSEPIN